MSLPRSRRILFSGLVALATLGVLELVGRTLPAPERGASALASHPTRGWTLPVSATFSWGSQPATTNSLGMRSPEPRGGAPGDYDDVTRVLVVGDSSVFGDGVTDQGTLPTQLAARLGSAFDVQNGGVPGYTCPQVRDLVDELRPAFSPDLLLAYVMHNDARFVRQQDQPWLVGAPKAWQDLGLLRLIGTAVLTRAARQGRTRTPLPIYQACLTALVADQHEHGGETVLIVPISDADLRISPQRAADALGHLVDYRRVMATVAADTDSLLVDLAQTGWAEGARADDLMVDPVHPSSEGHRRIAGQIHQQLIDAGRMPGPTRRTGPETGPRPPDRR